MPAKSQKIKFDDLQIYFGEPYTVNVESAEGSITLYQPTIGDIVKIGYEKFYENLNIFVANTTMYRTMLWDIGIDWNEFSDYQLFLLLFKNIDDKIVEPMFRDVKLSNFKPFEETLENEKRYILYDEKNHIEINEEVYNYISQYYRTVFNIHPKDMFTKGETMKKLWIHKDKRNAELNKFKKNPDEGKFSLKALISSCVNHSGFKYKLSELKELPVATFFDSVQRLQIYEQSTALLKGMYSGMIDSKEIKQEQIDFMRNF